MTTREEVLAGQGFVELIDSVGNDLSVTRAARVSYGGDLTERESAKEKRLIRYLLTNRHTSPFEHVHFTFHVKAPIFVARQWMRHRTWSYNEISARYVELEDDLYYPEHWRMQAEHNKQMSDGEAPLWVEATSDQRYNDAITLCWSTYQDMLGNGVSREMARMVLPVSTFTRFYGTVNLKNLMDFLSLRDHGHAQHEIREYAQAMRRLVEPIVPMAMEVYDANA